MKNTNSYQAAYLTYRAALIESAKLHDPRLTPEANQAERYQARVKARQALRAAVPERVTGPDPVEAVLATLAPRTADDIAVQGRERQKVETLLDNDRNLLAIVDAATETRCAVILDMLETSPRVLASADPEGAQVEVRARVMDRLTALGHDGAQKAQEVAQERALVNAWADVLEATADGQEPGYGPRATLFQADHDGYAATLGMRPNADDARTLSDADRTVHNDAIREQANARTAGQDTGLMEAGQ
ncbi:hypothetical protein [Brachybacterium squillarum]|uniref:hypothetical protein n=1 Tax=Brachybacterium squillarum TaxID=661979 RepID=UPI0002629A3F|nr:hypothetical protein [Brachybacterium squillarum]